MKIIKDKQIIDNSWTHLSDEDTISTDHITVSLARWKDEQSVLIKHQKHIGIRLSSSDDAEDIIDSLDKISLIALEFPAFTDGRAFSQARLLRSRHHYQGEIRAIGHYMPDQVFYLHRVGINAFEFETTTELEVALASINDFSVTYQSSTH